MAITRSDELRHSPSACVCDTKSSPGVIVIIIRSWVGQKDDLPFKGKRKFLIIHQRIIFSVLTSFEI
jgi:hypothetical protein